jgi:acyl dehydratase
MPPVVTKMMNVGYELPFVSRKWTIDIFKRGDEKTIHNDYEAAAREGLPAPIAVGPTVAALIFRMMMLSFEDGWIRGGKVSIVFRRPIFIDDYTTAKGVVKEVIEEGLTLRYVCDVWIENQKGKKIIVGTASALVR